MITARIVRTKGLPTGLSIEVDILDAEWLADVLEAETHRTAEQGVNGGLGDQGGMDFAKELRPLIQTALVEVGRNALS